MNHKWRLAFLLLSFASLLWLGRPSQAADPCAIPSFGAAANISLNAPRAVVVADFNNDGKLDIVAANNRTSGTISILLGNGTGGFSTATNISGGRNPTFVESGDLNGDGNADLILTNETNTQGELTIFLGNGMGGFAIQPPVFLINGTQNRTTAVAVADVNSDSKADLVVTSATFNAVSVLLGDGTGKVTFYKTFSSGGFGPSYLVMKDLNGDTKLDVA